ncbi:hypothetical protein MMC18_006864 [Xylographa bjoerkii]|nr:hypothetical protein [Xylographa bjoerkii]
MSSSTCRNTSSSDARATEGKTTSYIALLNGNGDFGDTFWKSERKDGQPSSNGNGGSHAIRSNKATIATSHGSNTFTRKNGGNLSQK